MSGSYERMKKLCIYHKLGLLDLKLSPNRRNGYGYYPTHDLLDQLDKKIGVNTRGGLHHDSFCSGYATPNNYVGTRIRLHEEYIRPDVPHFLCGLTGGTFSTRQDAPTNYDEWCSNHISASHWGLFPGE